MPENLSQRDPRWSNYIIGNSDKTLHDYGCTIVSLSMLLGITPDIVETTLHKHNGFSGAYVIWAKIPEAFPQVKSATRHWTYDNDIVASNLPCLVEVNGSRIGADKHWVLYIGNQKMIDPWTGVTKSTSYYPPTGCAVIELDENYNPGEEKIYTESQMTKMREERDANWRLYEEEKNKSEILKSQIEKYADLLKCSSKHEEIEPKIKTLISVESELTTVKSQITKKEIEFERKSNQLKADVDALGKKINQQQKKYELVIIEMRNDYEERIKELSRQNEKLQIRLNELETDIDKQNEKKSDFSWFERLLKKILK